MFPLTMPPIVNQLTRNVYVWLAVAICIGILGFAAFERHLAGVLHITPLPGAAWITILALSIVPVVIREAAAIAVRVRH